MNAPDSEPTATRALHAEAKALHEAGRPDAARVAYDCVLRADPDHFDALWLLASLLASDATEAERAVALTARAIDLDPRAPGPHIVRGAALKTLGRTEAALASYDAAIALSPGSAAAHYNRALALLDAQRPEEALESLDRAIASEPGLAKAHRDRASALLDLRRPAEAHAGFQVAIGLDPADADAHAALAVALIGLHRHREAVEACDHALALSPNHAATHHNRGMALQYLNRFDEALADFDKATTLRPADLGSALARGMVNLLLGRLEIGWPDYEHREGAEERTARNVDPARLWLGTPDPTDKLLFLYHEQGLGDTIQFCRYASLLRARGVHVILNVHDPLRALVQAMDPSVRVIGETARPEDFDYHCPLLSVPLAIGTTLDTIPPMPRPFVAPPDRRTRFAERLGPRRRPRVGLAWSGNPEHLNDANRSIAFHRLGPLLRNDIEWICLQKEIRPSDAAAFDGSGRVAFHGEVLEDFSDTAALVDLVDLVIAVDTSVAHLAGAMAKPVWILLPALPDWRWLLERSDSPWYPSARLFRQPAMGDWESVIAKVAEALAARWPPHERSPPPLLAPSENDERDAATQFDLGASLWGAGRNADALARFEQAIALRPGHARSHGFRGLILLGLKRPDEALASLDRAVAIDPDYAAGFANRGVALEALDRPVEALASYDRALRLKPDSPSTHYNRGVVLQTLGRHDAALAAFDQAIALGPANADAHCNRAVSLVALGRAVEALDSCDRALGLNAGHAKAHLSRGVALGMLEQAEAALASYDRSIDLDPDSVDAHFNRGVALQTLNRPAEALACYARVLALRPNHAEAFVNQGAALKALGRAEEALASYRQGVGANPGNRWARHDMGVVLQSLRRHAEGLACFEAAIAIDPDYADAHASRGAALVDLGRPTDALAVFDTALSLAPNHTDAIYNRGKALESLLRHEEALAHFDRTLQLRLDHPDAALARAMLNLRLGRFEAGWREYETRPGLAPEAARHVDDTRRLRGVGNIAGKRVLIWHEQGLGDTLQFSRYASAVRALGAAVTFEVQPPLAPLLAGQDPAIRVVDNAGDVSSFDLHCPLLSLPLAFGSRLEAIPSMPRLLSPPPGRGSRFETRLGPPRRARIGLAWSGNPEHPNDANRSIPFNRISPLLLDTVDWICLQKEIRPADAAAFAADGRVACLGEALTDFADTAALADLMDLVITVDTSAAHLAGAMGKPVWVLLPFVPDWRWMLDRSDSPWYPTARLFRQPAIGDWEGVIAAVRRELAIHFA